MFAAGTKDSSYTYSNGLVNNHAYALLGIYTLSNGVRLVKTSNPWGVDVYTGDWSDNSSKWTSTFRAAVGSTVNENDGVFFQTVEQLVDQWDTLYISKDVSKWQYSSWLNIGRDIKSSSETVKYYCTTANCRSNKFTLTSKDT